MAWKKVGKNLWENKRTKGRTTLKVYLQYKPKARIHKPYQVYWHDGVPIHYPAIVSSSNIKKEAISMAKKFMKRKH